jgi:predicted nucleic acid-binding protein
LLYDRVLIPQAVLSELQHSSAPDAVRAWCNQPPSWLEVSPQEKQLLPISLEPLDPGERAAIALAEQIGSSQIAMDDLRGRRFALQRGLSVIGTLGLLRAASREGHLDLEAAISRLVETNFRVSTEVIKRLLKEEQNRPE